MHFKISSAICCVHFNFILKPIVWSVYNTVFCLFQNIFFAAIKALLDSTEGSAHVMKRKLTTLWHIILQWEQINDIFFELLHQNDDAEFCIIIWASFLCNILPLSDSKEEEEKYYSVQIFRKIRGLCLMKWPDEIFFWICHILFMHKPTIVFSIILFRVVLFFSPNECPGLRRHRSGH